MAFGLVRAMRFLIAAFILVSALIPPAHAEDESDVAVSLWLRTCSTYPQSFTVAADIAQREGFTTLGNGLTNAFGNFMGVYTWHQPSNDTLFEFIKHGQVANCVMTVEVGDLNSFSQSFNLKVHAATFAQTAGLTSETSFYVLKPSAEDKYLNFTVMITQMKERNMAIIMVSYKTSD